MKKMLSLVLCLCMALSIAAAASAEPLPEYTGNMVKLSEEPITLTMFASFDANRYKSVATLADLPCMKEMAAKTNVTIDFIHPASGSEKEQLNLILSSGKLPDIMSYNWSTFSTTADQLYDNGMIYDCRDLIMQYCPNYRAILESDPKIMRDASTDSGLIPGFNLMQFSEPLKNTQGYILRADWLEKVGMKEPVTIDDWYNVLCAFRDQDVNGNGDPNDEIPLTTTIFPADNNENIGIEYFYSAWGKVIDFYVGEDNHAHFGPYEPEYKEYLLTMRKWIEEGLIDPDFATNDNALACAKFSSSQAGCLHAGLGDGLGKFIAALGDESLLTAACHPVMKEGDTNWYFSAVSPGVSGLCAVISKNCKNPEIAAKWLDMLYGGDGMMLAQYGIEGESYTMVDGYPTLSDYILHNPDGKGINVALSEFCLGANFAMPMWNDSAVREQRMMTYPSQRVAAAKLCKQDNSRRMPNLSLTADENVEFAALISECETYMQEATLGFLLGENDIETGFDDYMQTMKDLGIEEALAIKDGALQRYYNR